MVIKNITQDTVLAVQHKECRSMFRKAIGLMFSRTHKNLVFYFNREKHVPLHMIGVFFPIDVLFLDKDKKIVDMKQGFQPFTFYTPESKAQYVIELRNGIIEKTGTRIGDRIEF